MLHSPLDGSVFRWIESQTTETDRQALLSIQDALCARGPYRYLEVGSHIGGSLQPHIIDPRCLGIYSIDPRPLEQPDERWTFTYKYEGNSTERMLALLAQIPGANLGKLQTFESASWELPAASIPPVVGFAFIDGEHTNAAVLRDFHAVRRFMAPDSVLAFHDCFVIPHALLRIRRMLRREQASHRFLYFPGSAVVAIAFGAGSLAEALVRAGWQEKLPIAHWQSARLFALRHLRSVYALRHRYRRVRGADAS
jgi:hypothetical protein